MTGTDDLAHLLVRRPTPALRYGQGTILSFDRDTFNCVVDWNGVRLQDVHVFAGVDALAFAAGTKVALLGWDATGSKGVTQWFILGRFVRAGQGFQLTGTLRVPGTLELVGSGAIIVRHPNGATGAIYGNLRSADTGAPSGHGLLVQADDGLDIFRAKQDEHGEKQVYVGEDGAPVDDLQMLTASEAHFVDAQFRVEAGTDITLLPQSPTTSQGVWIAHATTGNAANCHLTAGGLVLRSTSSRRYKQDIEDHYVDPGLVLGLRPRSWRDKGEVEADPDTTNRHVGLIAEEVDELGLTEFVAYDSDGRPDGVAYDRLAIGLLEVVQAQQAQIDALTAWAAARGYTPPDQTQAAHAHKPVRAVPRPAPRPQREAPPPRE